MKDNAFLGFVAALVVATALTPVVARFARRIGAVDGLKERGLAREATPLLGGLAIFAGVLAGALITAVGAVDDWRELTPAAKLLGQVAAALVLVESGVSVDNITLPFIHFVDFGAAGGVLTVLGIVALMNVVNFSDGVDGLAAGVCAVSAAAFAIIAFDLGRQSAGILAAVTCGAALGFLVHNFHPASVFMGDCGSNLLGLLLGAIIVEGSLKTNALVALIVPLVVLAVPFLDTGFVMAKRIKYRRPVYQGDSNHFHHRFHRIGFSQRRTVLYLYGWTITMAALAVAVRFIPYTDDRGHWNLGWSIVLAGCFAVAFAASVYLVLVLEILKLRRLRAWQLRHADPATTDAEVDAEVERELETGEFRALETQ
jgi:UDP-GlcNAc:undecaprenyl-phosphate GlcNAc-1-phosphate transferase